MKLNRMICPRCEHESYTDAAYTLCDACGAVFYASQQKHVQLPMQTTFTVNPVVQPFGLPLRLDTTMPPNRIEIRNNDGKVLGAIENLGAVTVRGDDK